MSHLPSYTSSKASWAYSTSSRRIRWASITLGTIATIALMSTALYYNLRPRPVTHDEYVAHTHNLTVGHCDGDCSSEQLDMTAMEAFSKGLREIYGPIALPPTTTEWLDTETGIQYKLTDEQMSWTSSLGQSFCIADIDTRHFDKDGQILGDTFTWTKADPLSAGMLNHFVYASIHNYSYHIVNTQPWPNGDRDNVWTKIPQLKKLLESEQCRIVISLDSDAVFQHLELPIEFLLNKWHFTPETSMALPNDTAYYMNSEGRRTGAVAWMTDIHGVLSINAGVTIAQDLPRTREMVDAWISCPDEDGGRFPGCARYRHGWPAEQGAFANHVRYYYNQSNDLRIIPCGDANGFPTQGMDCRGTFVRHFTTQKKKAKDGVASILMESLSSLFAAHRSGTDTRKQPKDAR